MRTQKICCFSSLTNIAGGYLAIAFSLLFSYLPSITIAFQSFHSLIEILESNLIKSEITWADRKDPYCNRNKSKQKVSIFALRKIACLVFVLLTLILMPDQRKGLFLYLKYFFCVPYGTICVRLTVGQLNAVEHRRK